MEPIETYGHFTPSFARSLTGKMGTRPALGLTDAADIGGDAAIAPGIAPQLELPQQLDGGVAAGIPALQEIVLIGIEDTPPIVAPVLPHGPRRHLQIPLDCAPAAAHLRGNGRRAPA